MALLVDDLPDQAGVFRLTTVQAKQLLNRQPKKAKQFLHRAFASIEDLADNSGASEILMDMREELIGSGAFSGKCWVAWRRLQVHLHRQGRASKHPL